jgi:hypothetical protein
MDLPAMHSDASEPRVQQVDPQAIGYRSVSDPIVESCLSQGRPDQERSSTAVDAAIKLQS